MVLLYAVVYLFQHQILERPELYYGLKTKTVLQYDMECYYMRLSALLQRNVVKSKATQPIPWLAQLFKLHLGDMKEDEKPYLPLGLHHKQAITKGTLTFRRHWTKLYNLYRQQFFISLQSPDSIEFGRILIFMSTCKL